MNIRLCIYIVALTLNMALEISVSAQDATAGSNAKADSTQSTPTLEKQEVTQQSTTEPATTPANADPIVAKIDLTLKLKDQVIDTIGKGDLLTVVTEREKDYVILTVNGKKGAIAKENAAKLADSLPIYDEPYFAVPRGGAPVHSAGRHSLGPWK